MGRKHDPSLETEELYGAMLDNQRREIALFNDQLTLEERLAEIKRKEEEAYKARIEEQKKRDREYEKDKNAYLRLTPDHPIECPTCRQQTLAFDGKDMLGWCENKKCRSYHVEVDRFGMHQSCQG